MHLILFQIKRYGKIRFVKEGKVEIMQKKGLNQEKNFI